MKSNAREKIIKAASRILHSQTASKEEKAVAASALTQKMQDTEFKSANVTRFEVIDETGRAYVRSDVLGGGSGINVSLRYQDDGRTLKVFVSKRSTA